MSTQPAQALCGVGYREAGFLGAVAEIGFAYEHVPFYREHLDTAGLRPQDITGPAIMRQVPATRKVHYRKNFPHRVLARGKTLQEPFTLKSQSSGTGGERLTTVAHTYALADRMRATLAANPVLRDALAACRQHHPIRYAAPNCSDVECATPFTTMEDRVLPDGTLVLPVSHDLLATPEQLVRQAIDEVKAFRPHWFYADATHLAFLVRNLRRHREPPPEISAIALTYTLVTGVARRQITEFFGADVPKAEIVSMSELGWVTVECPLGAMHINNTKFYVEFLVGDRPAEPGEPAELVITSIGDRLLPHLRYRTGDVYRAYDEPCACGSELPVVRHEGRWQTMIELPGGALVGPRDVDDAVGADLPIDAYLLHQRADRTFTLRYLPSAPAARPGRELEDRLRVLLGHDTRLTVEPADYIPSQRSGKFASCVTDVPPRDPTTDHTHGG